MSPIQSEFGLKIITDELVDTYITAKDTSDIYRYRAEAIEPTGVFKYQLSSSGQELTFTAKPFKDMLGFTRVAPKCNPAVIMNYSFIGRTYDEAYSKPNGFGDVEYTGSFQNVPLYQHTLEKVERPSATPILVGGLMEGPGEPVLLRDQPAPKVLLNSLRKSLNPGYTSGKIRRRSL